MQLFLTSSVNEVARDIATKMETKNKKLAFIYTAAEVEEGSARMQIGAKRTENRLVDASVNEVGFEVN
jgi:hypothetical protein